MGMREEDLAGLSEEERAALEDDDDETEILGKIAGDGSDDGEGGAAGDDEGDGDGDGEGEGDGDDGAANANTDEEGNGDAGAAAGDGEGGKPAGNEAAGTGDDEGAAAAVPDEFRPEFKAERPEGLTEKLAELETQSNDLLAKFKEGDIDLPEFMAQKAAIDDEKLKLMLADGQAKWAEGQNTDTREQRWKWEQERFFASPKAEIYKDTIVLGALDTAVKQISADPANAKKPASFFLEEADRQVRKRFNMPAGEQTPAANEAAKPRQPDLSKVPKTLAQLPAAEMAETGDVEFAYLDKLEGIALEQALRKLTPEQEARYLGSAA